MRMLDNDGMFHSDIETSIYEQVEVSTLANPERALMAAVLFEGIQSYLGSQSAKSKLRKRQFREAQHWIFKDQTDYPFSFNNVCEAIGVNPNYLRCGLNAVQSTLTNGPRKVF